MLTIPLVIPEGQTNGTPVDLDDFLNDETAWQGYAAAVRLLCPADVDGLTTIRLEYSVDGVTFVPERDKAGSIVTDYTISNGARVRLSPSEECWVSGWVRAVIGSAAPVGGLTFELGVRRV